MRQAKRGTGKSLLTKDRIKQLNDLEFVWEVESMFEKFYRYALLYKAKFGHVDIKQREKINGYNIGFIYGALVREYKKGRLTNEQLRKLKEIGIDITKNRSDRRFQSNLQLVRKALDEGIVITQEENIYKGINLYSWYMANKNKFTDEETELLKKLIPNRKNNRMVTIVNIQNKKSNTYETLAEAGRALYSEFHVVDSEKQGLNVVYNRLSGKRKNPIYKNRFRFE